MKDKCVICGKETQYDINTPINFRYNYVEGAGQVCKECSVNDSNHYKEDEYIKVPVKEILKRSNYFDLGSYVFELYHKK